jgi:RimJ/RimL family protein N-acetyltransferase
MTRALRLMLGWGFGLPGIEVVYWRAQVGNWASRRVARRCGFRMEGTVRGLLEQRGERRDAWIGSLRRGEPLTGQPDGPA